MEHLSDRGRCPRAAPWAGDPRHVQRSCDADEALAGGAGFEGATNHGGLGVVDLAPHVGALASITEHLHIAVPVHDAARDVAGERLPPERLMRPLPRFLPLHLGGEVGQREHDLVHGRVERPLTILELEEHAHAGVHDLLQRPRRLVASG
jgi:hypothetical protein